MQGKAKRLFVVILGIVLIIAFAGCSKMDQNEQPPANNPPNKPSNPNPAHEATGVSRATFLSWQCSDPDGDPLTYDVYLSKGPNQFTLVASNCTITTYDPPTVLDPMTTYYWKVLVRDSKGATNVSDVWFFTTSCCPPSK